MSESYPRAARASTSSDENPPRLSPEEQGAEFFRGILGGPADDGRPIGCLEIRVLEAAVDRNGDIVKETRFPKTIAGYFDSYDRYRAELKRLKNVSAYVTVNPVRREFLARLHNRLDVARATAKDGDIVCLRHLYIDFDARRPTGISATQEELDAALARRDLVLSDHADLAAASIWGCSGNGGFIVARLPDLPNDEEHTALIGMALASLAARYNDDRVEIDPKTRNASRVMPAIPSIKAKGDSIPERPHRRTSLDSPPGDRPTFDLAGWLRRNPVPTKAPDPAPTAAPEPSTGRAKGTTKSGGPSVEERASLYIAKCDPAISGQKGHDAAFKAACKVGPGFDLPPDVAFRLLLEEFNPKCVPPWSEKELRHKVADAYEKEKRRGFLRDAPHAQQSRGCVGSVSPSDHTRAGNGTPNGAPKGGCVGSVSPSDHTRPGFSGDPRPIAPDLRPVPEFPPELLPDPLRTWALDIADRAQCALEFIVVGLVIALATVIGRKVGIRPKRHDYWLVVCNLWGLIVGRPGVLKTHALEEALAPLRRLAAAAQERHAAALAEFQRQKMVADAKRDAAKDELKKAAKKPGVADSQLQKLAEQASSTFDAEPPAERRYITCDATIEKLGELLERNPNGILQFRDELAGFLRSFEKKGREMDRPFYLEGWNGTGSYTYDRIERGTIHIKAVCISILGSIQPGPLASYLRLATSAAGDDGLINRFQLGVFPDQDRPFKLVDRVPNLDAQNKVFKVFEALDTLDPKDIHATADTDGDIPYLRFDDDAQAFFYRWLEDLEKSKLRANEPPVIESHLSKFRSLMPSLALIFHLVEHAYEGGDGGPVTLPAARRAAGWCAILEEHARRIYAYADDGDVQPALTLAERLKASLPNPFVPRDVQRKCWKDLGSAEEIQLALSVLEDRKWVAPEEVPPGEKGGRPTVRYWIHPSILSGQDDSEKSRAGMPQTTDKTDSTPEPAEKSRACMREGTDRTDATPGDTVVEAGSLDNGREQGEI